MEETILTAQNLKFRYDSDQPVYALDGVSTEVKRGEFVAVLGANGCGKSTLAKHFNAILLPESGKVYVEGMDTADDDKLYDIRRKIRTAQNRVRDSLQRYISGEHYSKYLQEQIITVRNGRFVIPVKAEYKNEIKGLVHDSSSSGATLFIEPVGVVEANNEIRILERAEADEAERYLFELSSDIAGNSAMLRGNHHSITTLALIFAKSQLSFRYSGMMPKISEKSLIRLKNARHPLLNKDTCVPISISVGEDFDCLVITGPNTGGKTVSLKTAGLFALMAQAGLQLPVGNDSEIGIFEDIFADIGDEQSIEQSLSTFSSHMVNIVSILENLRPRTLVLFDELCAGTDPVEGAALAIAILERLRDKHAKIASTTHYAELKEFALRTPGVENGSCEFDVATLKPTYRLLIGVPGKSNAFAISKRLGIDDEIISRASELVSNENRQFEDVVEKLEKRRQSLEKQLENANRLTAKANTEKQKAENEMQKAKQRAEREIEKARQEAQRIISRTRAQADAVAEELEKARKAKDMSVQARTQLKKNIDKMEAHADPVKARNTPDEEYKLPRPLKVGDTVLIYDIDKNATVLAPPNKDGVVLVQAGIIKTRVDIKNLRLLKSNNKPAKDRFSSTRNVPSRMDVRPETEVDVRGETAFDAINIVDKAIDNAVLSGVSKMTIIHGKGTGVLKREINKYLKTNKSVKSQRLGVFGEGEDGVTIIELK